MFVAFTAADLKKLRELLEASRLDEAEKLIKERTFKRFDLDKLNLEVYSVETRSTVICNSIK